MGINQNPISIFALAFLSCSRSFFFILLRLFARYNNGIRAVLGSVDVVASEMNEVISILQKISLDMSGYEARQEQLEASHEQSCRTQYEALNKLREVLNEVMKGGKRPERD